MSLKEKLEKILPPKSCFNIKVDDNEVYIEYGDMYESPELSLKQLNALCDFFGAEDVKTSDGNSHGGCETCDWGSLYCIDIKVIGATKNLKV